VGRTLGSYRLLYRLAEGGMGVVYFAEHMRLNRQVAIKVLRREMAGRTDLVARFFREARAVNDIGHPNIVQIYDFVEHLDEEPPIVYMVLEFLEGRDLGAYIEARGPLDPREAVGIGRQVASALEAVHKAQVLHRDLKPENIFLTPPDPGQSCPKVKLLDFGVAKDVGDRLEEVITAPGITLGTPEFMAPEQILARNMDHRVDIYALGLLLYYMLAGDSPYSASTAGRQLKMQLKGKPPPLASRRVGRAPVPAELEAVIMRCLEMDPDRRYQSAGEVEQALERTVRPSVVGRLLERMGLGSPWPLVIPLALILLSLVAVAALLLL
jgi:serine/threonine-protein kinase